MNKRLSKQESSKAFLVFGVKTTILCKQNAFKLIGFLMASHGSFLTVLILLEEFPEFFTCLNELLQSFGREPWLLHLKALWYIVQLLHQLGWPSGFLVGFWQGTFFNKLVNFAAWDKGQTAFWLSRELSISLSYKLQLKAASLLFYISGHSSFTTLSSLA